jgi:hypothetical protein
MTMAIQREQSEAGGHTLNAMNNLGQQAWGSEKEMPNHLRQNQHRHQRENEPRDVAIVT